jgi:hypothetical protein
MSYGVEIEGETTLVGWDDYGETQPWSEIEAASVLIQLRCEFMNLGACPPLMRVVDLAAQQEVRRHAAKKRQC